MNRRLPLFVQPSPLNRPAQLLLGAGGTGKSEVIKAMRRVVQRLGLGGFVISSWTGVAAATVPDDVGIGG